MNRYLLFSGECYYPCGGFRDFDRSFKSLKGVLEYFKKHVLTDHGYDWFHVVDVESGEIITSDLDKLESLTTASLKEE